MIDIFSTNYENVFYHSFLCAVISYIFVSLTKYKILK